MTLSFSSTPAFFWSHALKQRLTLYASLIKAKVIAVIAFAALSGLVMAADKNTSVASGISGFWGILLASAGSAVLNQLFEAPLDKRMTRTEKRPLALERISPAHAFGFACLLITSGIALLAWQTHALAAWATAATTVGYAVIYTRWLKPSSPQNIVIGGLTGAMPPLLGWLCLKPSLDAQPLLMVLIIFLWTPAHFWPLAIHYRNDYAKSHLPMLPITHGVTFTTYAILMYTVLTALASVLPFLLGLQSHMYLAIAMYLNIRWFWLSVKCVSSVEHCMPAFAFSIRYLLLLFASMMLDHLCFSTGTSLL